MVRMIAVGCAFIAFLAVIALAVMYYVIWKNTD